MGAAVNTIAVVGSTGRVGSAIVEHLRGHHDVRLIRRGVDHWPSALSEQIANTSVLVNAAGVAHLDAREKTAAIKLREGNVDLPMALAQAALDARAGFLHISSSKAAKPSDSPYAASKAAGEAALKHAFAQHFTDAGLSMVILRPVALLFPPLDAGKLRHLRHLRHIPIRLVPAVPLPVLIPRTFLQIIDEIIDGIVSHQLAVGFSQRDISSDEQGSLRDVAQAFHREPHLSGEPA